MIVLAYLWILALVPLLVKKEDREIQWHAKHGLVILIVEVILWIVAGILSAIPVLGCVSIALWPILWLAALIVRIVCIVKGVAGERFLIPGLSQYADKF
jgi:uncharacterized membrane protein